MNKLNILLLTISLFTTNIAPAQTTRPEAEKQLAHDIYKQFIEVPSGLISGATTPVAEIAAQRLKTAGFTDHDIFIGGASPNKANLVVRYRATGAKKPLLLLAHIDVVEADRKDWSTDPFKLVERDGYFYGRGTTDDKAQAAIWIANLIQLKQENFKPDRDIIVALTADEEGHTPYNGVKWLLKNHRDLIDADFALNEGGWGDMNGNKLLSNNIQISEKYILNFRFEAHNKGGHSSLPVADNAIYDLAEALQKLSQLQFPLQTNAVTTIYFQNVAKLISGPEKEDLAQIATHSQDAMRRIAATSPGWNAMLRTTCIPTLLEGGHAMNALPQLAAANINCRVMPDDSPDTIRNTLQQAMAGTPVEIKQISEFTQSPSSPVRSDVLKAVTDSTHAIWPGIPTIPVMVMGATDGRFLRAAGIPTYGVTGFFIDRNDIRAHGRDERLSIQAFYEGQAFLYDLVKRLAS